MKFDNDELATDTVRATTPGAPSPRRLRSPAPWAKSDMPYWLQDTLSFLSVAGIVAALFLVGRIVDFVIRAASGTL